MSKLVTHVFSNDLLVKPESGLLPDTVLYQMARANATTGKMVTYLTTRLYGSFMGIVTPFPPLEGKFAFAEHVAYPKGLMEVYQLPNDFKGGEKKCKRKK